MKLVTYLHDGKKAVGVLTTDGAAARPLPFADMNALIDSPREQLSAAVDAAEKAGTALALSEVTLLAPIPRPRQDVICLGINYKAHAAEAEKYNAEAFKKERPIPIYFSKRVSEAVAPEGFIESHPGLVERLDYEAELAVIIGKTAKNVKAADAADYIFGYFGKSLDGFTPMGPCITTADEIAFPPALAISSRINGELRQDSTTDLLITSIADIIEELSSGMTLLPGTIIATGTPAGVGMGSDPPKFLKHGDVVECSIEGIGTLRNTVR